MNKRKQLEQKAILLTVLIAAQCASTAMADNGSTNDNSAAEIAALKKEIQALEQKVDSLERKQESQATSAPPAQIEALDQKVKVLEREHENDEADAAALAKAQPKISLGKDGFSFGSADSNFVAQLHAVVQVDSRSFFQDGNNNGTDGFLLRRARPIFSGTVYHDFDYYFMPDFGGSTVQIFDAYLNYRYNSALQLEAGKFKAPIGLEALVSDRDLLFNERSLATDLVPNRDVGIQLHGEVLGGSVSYALAVVSGGGDYSSTTINTPTEDDRAFEGRLFFQPWKNSDVSVARGLGFGVAGSYLFNEPQTNSATGLSPGYSTDGQQKLFTYAAGVNANGVGWRVSPQAYYYYGPLGILGEYVVSDQQVSSATKSADINNNAWEVTGSWLLTGENATYGAVEPSRVFDPLNGQWGAWQLVARYAALSIDDTTFTDGFASSTKNADGANAWAVGLNWYLNKNIKADLSFSRTTFSGFTGKAAPGVVPAQPESVLFSRIQLAF